MKERTKELVERIANEDVRLVVFLDRSARPVSWMLRAAWNEFADGNPMPKIKFANIGSEKKDVVGYVTPPRPYNFNTKKVYEEVARDYWGKLGGSEEYIEKMKRDVGGLFPQKRDAQWRYSSQEGEILIVDDSACSGFTLELAAGFFQNHFPQAYVNTYSFLRREDAALFKNNELGPEKLWQGVYLPWNTDKTLTLLEEREDSKKITATPERDPEKRTRGIQLKRELEGLFQDEEETKEEKVAKRKKDPVAR